MSQQPDQSWQNPYAVGQSSPPAAAWPPAQTKRPTLCTTMFIIDLIFCLLRVPMVLFGALGASMIESGRARATAVPAHLAWWEVYAGIAIVLFGLPANIMLLSNKRAGIMMGYTAIVAMLSSLAVGLMQMPYLMQGAKSPEESIGQVIGIGIAFVIRLGLNGMYIAALIKFSKWLATRQNSHSAMGTANPY